ncbi:MAG: S41 family peptidase [Bacteroidales bacterium]|jgi:carboxyl-terminal processing protease|nr:S41 family peptidase [Bacteroidales bacterium]
MGIIMTPIKKILFTAVLAVSPVILFAQSKEFKVSQSLEIQYDILKELNKSFVDTLDIPKLMNTGIVAMLESLDPYTVYMPEEDEEELTMLRTASYGGIGSIIRKIDSLGVLITTPYKGSPAVKFGLEPGDVIEKINGEDTKPLTADQCTSRMKGQPNTQVTFTVRKGRTGEVKDIVVTRDRVHIPDVSYYGILRDSIGYIRVDGFTVGGAQDVRNAFISLKEQGIKRLALDLRSNGGGLMDEAVKLLSIFLPKGTMVVSAKGRAKDANFSYSTTIEPVDTLMPLMVLVNSGSASSSEIVAGALQDLDRAFVVGTRTYGKGLVQSIIPVSYNGKLKVTTAKYYTPSGRCVQALDYSNRNEDGSVGAVPDSLKKEFKTKLGRSVYDGGGIAPDSTIKAQPYSRPAFSMVVNDIFGEYAIEFYKKNLSIPPVKDFKVTDEQYADFVEFASKKKFDSRSDALTHLDKMINAAKDEDLYEVYKAEFDALKAKLDIDKKQMLILKRSEFQPLLEEAIVTKYYYTEGSVEKIIQSDDQLHKALDLF